VDEPSGSVKARVYVSEYGRAYPSLYTAHDGVPEFGVGKQDGPRLDSAVQKRLPIRAKGQSRWIDGARTRNIVGTLPGESSDEILITAHADTKYPTPGANDNTASMITMLMLAHAMSGTRPPRTVTFLATTGEELGGKGVEHYARVRKGQGTLRNIRVCLNFDSLTWGPNLEITSTDHALVQMIEDIHRQLGRATPKVYNKNDTMDSAPFHAAGARTVHFNSRGDDARTLPLYHRPEDRAETVNPAFVEGSFQVLTRLIERLETEKW
jgi:aminopeptidase-like protein